MNWKNIGILIFAITSLAMIVSCQNGQEITETENSTPQNLLPQNTQPQDPPQQESPQQESPIFKSTFNYSSECTWNGLGGGVNCNTIANDGLTWSSTAGQDQVDGNYTQATAAANNPNGDGGYGARFWVGDGTNVQTKPVRLTFAERQTEIWLRWYQRYQHGFAWTDNEVHYDKTFFIWITPDTKGNSTLQILPQFYSSGYRIYIQSGGANDQLENNSISWTDTFGTTSDGLWHMFEVYIKLDTDSTYGIGKAWIDGTRVINSNDVDFSAGDVDSRLGVKFMDFQSNQNSPNNGGAAYVDYDDIEIWNTTPPNTDSFGDPWIGPLNEITSISGG